MKPVRQFGRLYIWKTLSPIYLRTPSKKEEWVKISEDFQTLWNIPHCIGAIDGKHIPIECPQKTGSKYYNYKGFFSFVLLAVCDAKYCFTFVDIGQYGSGNDRGVLKVSKMGKCFENDLLNVPESSKVQGRSEKLPYFLVGDEIFALKPWLMRPYPGKLSEKERIYNYRISRTRRTIENVFGIMSARWRILQKPIRADIKNAELIVQASVCLHIFLQLTAKCAYIPKGFIDSEQENGEIHEGDWRGIISEVETGLVSLPKAKGGRCQLKATDDQKALKDYFNSNNGSVSWQWEYVRRTGLVLTE